MTTRIFNRPKRVCADPVHTNSVAFVFIPQESALLSRASQPTMASAIGYGKPELSTLLGSGTFYFALTDVVVLCLSQLSRSIEADTRAPRLSDLRDSGRIEEESDAVDLP
jgi:hypothetical protein